MTRCLDVIVIGGGLSGSAIGYLCAARGATVTLLERATLGGDGATRYSQGIVRGYDPDGELMRWGLAGVAAWRRWNLAGPSPFRPCGVFYLLAERNVASALATVERHADADYPITVMRGLALRDLFPALRLADRDLTRQIALYEPRGGYCDPRLATRLYGAALRGLGGSVLEGVSVDEIVCSDSSVHVRTGPTWIEAQVGVLAAGANARALLPSLPLFSRSIPLTCFEDEAARVRHCLIDEVTGTYLRPEPPFHYHCGGARQADTDTPAELPPFEPAHHDTHRDNVATLLHGPVGRVITGVMGYDAYTRDYHPLLGFRPEHPRLCLATGFSGRGAKYIPAAAERLTVEILACLESRQPTAGALAVATEVTP